MRYTLTQKIGSEAAVVIIPEIYGVNQFIKNWSVFFNQQGYDTFCVDLSGCDRVYEYSESDHAYCDFITTIGFDGYKELAVDIKVLKKYYKKVVVFGSSVGATIGWRLSESPDCDGMIGLYGSRIRDYLDARPVCPCLLVFPEQEKSFEVQSIMLKLKQQKTVESYVLPGQHGFADPDGKDFHEQSGNMARDMIKYFLRRIKL